MSRIADNFQAIAPWLRDFEERLLEANQDDAINDEEPTTGDEQTSKELVAVEAEKADDELIPQGQIEIESTEQGAADEESIGEESINGESKHEESIRGESINGESKHEESIGEESIYRESKHEESIEEESINGESIGEESDKKESINEEAIGEDHINEEREESVTAGSSDEASAHAEARKTEPVPSEVPRMEQDKPDEES